MVKEVGFKQKWGEVAPASLNISRRRSSSCPRLETIVEEGFENHADFSKKISLFLPVAMFMVFYFLLYKDMTLCA